MLVHWNYSRHESCITEGDSSHPHIKDLECFDDDESAKIGALVTSLECLVRDKGLIL